MTGTADRPGVAARLLLLPIVAYRRWVSPALPARCRFYPSCSTYAVEALSSRGAMRGGALVLWRLLRCQPFHPGGYDPVPPARHRHHAVVPPQGTGYRSDAAAPAAVPAVVPTTPSGAAR